MDKLKTIVTSKRFLIVGTVLLLSVILGFSFLAGRKIQDSVSPQLSDSIKEQYSEVFSNESFYQGVSVTTNQLSDTGAIHADVYLQVSDITPEILQTLKDKNPRQEMSTTVILDDQTGKKVYLTSYSLSQASVVDRLKTDVSFLADHKVTVFEVGVLTDEATTGMTYKYKLNGGEIANTDTNLFIARFNKPDTLTTVYYSDSTTLNSITVPFQNNTNIQSNMFYAKDLINNKSVSGNADIIYTANIVNKESQFVLDAHMTEEQKNLLSTEVDEVNLLGDYSMNNTYTIAKDTNLNDTE